MFDCNSSSSSVRNEGVTGEACASYLVSLESGSVSRRKNRKKAGTKENGGDNSTRAGHVTPSFLTDDEEELQSNIDLVSLV